MPNPWPKVRLGEVLTPAERGETIDAAKEYRLLGVRLDGQGPFLRETLMGTQSSATKLFRVAAGDFIYSRLFACRGAFGVINKELDGCYVSGEFPAFVPVPGRVDVEFLKYWFRLPSVVATVDADCSGSTPLTRNRFKQHYFLALEIPLPPLAEQRRVVARIEELAAQIQEARTLRHQATEETEGLFISKLRAVVQECGSQSRKLPFTKIATLERRPVNVKLDEHYREIGVYCFGKGIFHKPPRTGADVGGKDLYQIQAGDFILQITFAWEGAVALAGKAEDGLFGSVRYLTFRVNEGICSPRYLLTYMKTPDAIAQLARISPGSAGRNRVLSVKRLNEVLVPVVPLDAQEWLNDALQAEVDTLKRLQAETATELDALLPAILDKAFKGGL